MGGYSAAGSCGVGAVDSYEARLLLRTSAWPGYHQLENEAVGVLLADIHEILERMEEHIQHADHLKTADNLSNWDEEGA